MTIDNSPVDVLDVADTHTRTDIMTGATLPGWWKYMNLVSYGGGKMRISFSSPFRGFRYEDVYSGGD